MIKLNKKEIIVVEGFDWEAEIEMLSEDFDCLDDMLVEAATRAVEGICRENPDEFKVGSVVKITFKKQNDMVKWGNAYMLMCNASLFSIAESIKKNSLLSLKIDLSKEPIIK